MIKLLKCEFRKFKKTYINSLSLLGMMVPVILVTMMFLFKRNDWIKAGYYTWDKFFMNLQTFFVLLVGPIITSFIAVFSVFHEYQSRTMKNVLSSPHSRMSIIASKMIYVSAFVILQYAGVALMNILCAFVLGFNVTFDKLINFSGQIIIAGATTLVLIPMMMFLTLLFKNFIAGMVITVAGTISNVLLINWEKSYFSPWAAPVDLSAIIGGELNMKMAYPLISIFAYLLFFAAATLVYFKVSDQNS
jgi:bacitracin transport system permease protein